VRRKLEAQVWLSLMPVEITALDIVYTKGGDEAIDRFNHEIGEL